MTLFFRLSLPAVAQKVGFASFVTIMLPYGISLIVCFVISLIYGPIFMILPGFIVFFTSISLRLYISRLYQIESVGLCGECLTGFFCCCCSIAQSKYITSLSVRTFPSSLTFPLWARYTLLDSLIMILTITPFRIFIPHTFPMLHPLLTLLSLTFCLSPTLFTPIPSSHLSCYPLLTLTFSHPLPLYCSGKTCFWVSKSVWRRLRSPLTGPL